MITAIITVIGSVLVAIIEANAAKDRKQNKLHHDRQTAQADIRAEEAKKLLQIVEANTRLTLGIADAIRSGRCNGNIDGGIEAVKDAESKYHDYAVELLKEKVSK